MLSNYTTKASKMLKGDIVRIEHGLHNGLSRRKTPWDNGVLQFNLNIGRTNDPTLNIHSINDEYVHFT